MANSAEKFSVSDNEDDAEIAAHSSLTADEQDVQVPERGPGTELSPEEEAFNLAVDLGKEAESARKELAGEKIIDEAELKNLKPDQLLSSMSLEAVITKFASEHGASYEATLRELGIFRNTSDPKGHWRIRRPGSNETLPGSFEDKDVLKALVLGAHAASGVEDPEARKIAMWQVEQRVLSYLGLEQKKRAATKEKKDDTSEATEEGQEDTAEPVMPDKDPFVQGDQGESPTSVFEQMAQDPNTFMEEQTEQSWQNMEELFGEDGTLLMQELQPDVKTGMLPEESDDEKKGRLAGLLDKLRIPARRAGIALVVALSLLASNIDRGDRGTAESPEGSDAGVGDVIEPNTDAGPDSTGGGLDEFPDTQEVTATRWVSHIALELLHAAGADNETAQQYYKQVAERIAIDNGIGAPSLGVEGGGVLDETRMGGANVDVHSAKQFVQEIMKQVG
ncbi:MAG: hypothetical protein ABIG71_03765 [Candidatus Uhrbacteria bacterium]